LVAKIHAYTRKGVPQFDSMDLMLFPRYRQVRMVDTAARCRWIIWHVVYLVEGDKD
jgi:hypothetical protein